MMGRDYVSLDRVATDWLDVYCNCMRVAPALCVI